MSEVQVEWFDLWLMALAKLLNLYNAYVVYQRWDAMGLFAVVLFLTVCEASKITNERRLAAVRADPALPHYERVEWLNRVGMHNYAGRNRFLRFFEGDRASFYM